jgi:nucleoside-diphosphate-sugar epimerase
MSEAILITGAAGFLGSALGQRLIDAGERVVGIDVVAAEKACFPCATMDVRDTDAIYELCRSSGVDRIVHAGGISGRSVQRDDKTAPIAINVMGTAAVFEVARRLSVRRVVLCSSGSAYGLCDLDPVTEGARLVPVNSYGASKVASEAILHAYAAESGIDGIALRIFQAYGPFRRTACTIKAMVEAATGGTTAKIRYRPDARCQFVYIDDVVSALMAALAVGPHAQRIYNVTGGTSLTLAEVARIAADVLPGLSVEFGDDPLSREYCLRRIDISAAERDLGYVPKVGLAEGIATYAARLRARRSASPVQRTL